MTTSQVVGAKILNFRTPINQPAKPDIPQFVDEDIAVLPNGSVYSVNECGQFKRVA